MRILIAGGSGQLGRAIARRAGDEHEVLPLGRAALDVADVACVEIIAGHRPDLVINAAAMTDVDGCEKDPDEAYRVNALGARNAALGAERAGAALLHVSTDFVFDGRKGAPYWEFDATNPISVYGASKEAGEALVRQACRRAYVVRTAWLYGLGGRNFVTTILRLAEEGRPMRVVDNEVGNPTFCDDLAEALLALVATGAYGLYHLAGEGACSRFDFALAILEAVGRTEVTVEPVDHFPRVATPPGYAPLRNFAAAELGVRLPPWREGLRRYVARGGARPAMPAAPTPVEGVAD